MSFWKFVRRMIILNFFSTCFPASLIITMAVRIIAMITTTSRIIILQDFSTTAAKTILMITVFSAAIATISMKTWTISTVSATAMTDKPNHNTSVL